MAVEMEAFEITDWDLQNEFNRPGRRRPTKHQQIYGIWADDSDEEENDNRPSFGTESRGKRDFTAPINFISGGFKDIKPEKPVEDDDERGSSDEEVKKVQRPAPSRNYPSNRSGFGGGARNRRFAGVGDRDPLEQSDQLGGWERYTRGIASKMMKQMGYKPGTGLGKDSQGIVTPIQAKKREGKGALGLYGPEHVKPKSVLTSHLEDDVKEDKGKKVRENLHQWKKKQGDETKVKYVYKTVEEVKSEGAYKKLVGDFSNLSSVKVIDMTGPEQRVLSGYHQIHQQHSKPDLDVDIEEERVGKGHHFALPELEHNLDLLVDMTEQAILRNDRELRRSKDRIVSLQHEDEQLSVILAREDKQIAHLTELLNLINSLENRETNITLSDAATIFKKLEEEYYEEYKMYELSDLAVTIVFPLFKKFLEPWDPLKNPYYGLDLFKSWKDILETEERARTNLDNIEGSFDPYHQLIWDIWMPVVRRAALNWSVRQPETIIELLENWIPLLPPWIFENCLSQLIYPRLDKEVTEWNPVTDTMPIHAWLHPWLPLMGDRLEALYAPIRHKLAMALTNWHPSDCSAKLILEPWRNVFSKGTMEAFVISNILPKLTLVMQSLIINPHQQHLDMWNWTMAWEDMLPQQAFVNLLDKSFFPRWLQVLCTWLGHNPNYEEITKWYMGWKSLVSPNLQSHPLIRDHFNKALDIMNHAVSNPQAPINPLLYNVGPRDGMPYMNASEPQSIPQPKVQKWTYDSVTQAIRGASSAATLSMSFKDMIEKKAEEAGILFAPVPNRYQEGKQVYRFGNSTMYIDRGVVFIFNDKAWVPTSLQSLLDIAM